MAATYAFASADDLLRTVVRVDKIAFVTVSDQNLSLSVEGAVLEFLFPEHANALDALNDIELLMRSDCNY